MQFTVQCALQVIFNRYSSNLSTNNYIIQRKSYEIKKNLVTSEICLTPQINLNALDGMEAKKEKEQEMNLLYEPGRIALLAPSRLGLVRQCMYVELAYRFIQQNGRGWGKGGGWEYRYFIQLQYSSIIMSIAPVDQELL